MSPKKPKKDADVEIKTEVKPEEVVSGKPLGRFVRHDPRRLARAVLELSTAQSAQEARS